MQVFKIRWKTKRAVTLFVQTNNVVQTNLNANFQNSMEGNQKGSSTSRKVSNVPEKKARDNRNNRRHIPNQNDASRKAFGKENKILNS